MLQHAIDVSGKIVLPGDTIAFGHDNGSTLELGKVTKVTPKKVWFTYVNSPGYTGCRDHTRVCKVV